VKPLFEIMIGFVVSLGMFVIGLAAATVLLTAEPERQPGPSVDVADLWTAEPRKVDSSAQDFERLPVIQIPSDPNLTAGTQTAAAGGVETTDVGPEPLDRITTASVQAADEAQGQKTPSNELSAVHAEWCAGRYRSYRPEDNSYTRYDGEQWPCVSPYSRDLAATARGLSPTPSHDGSYDEEIVDEPSSLPWLEASGDADGAAYINSDHVSYCFSRYRSYRPEDNTYQPYNGGPRRQCR
jgi:hypothetical protein